MEKNISEYYAKVSQNNLEEIRWGHFVDLSILLLSEDFLFDYNDIYWSTCIQNKSLLMLVDIQSLLKDTGLP